VTIKIYKFVLDNKTDYIENSCHFAKIYAKLALNLPTKKVNMVFLNG